MRTFKPRLPKRPVSTPAQQAEYRAHLIRRLNAAMGYSHDYLSSKTTSNLRQLMNRITPQGVKKHGQHFKTHLARVW